MIQESIGTIKEDKFRFHNRTEQKIVILNKLCNSNRYRPREEEEEEAYPMLIEVSSSAAYPYSGEEIQLSSASPFFP